MCWAQEQQKHYKSSFKAAEMLYNIKEKKEVYSK